VPLDLELGGDARLVLVSGPNMGGKTVLLKTVGLCVLLAHAAFPVPAAEGSRIPEIEVVGIDLGDEQSLDRGLSTFAAHLQALADMARRAGPRTLVLCDELGAGTDPDEGGALARALLEHFARAHAWGVVTTHLGSLKRVATETSGVRNGSLEFDLATLQPRFRYIPDVPGASHALAVAERLGFPGDLLARARDLTPEAARALERLTGELAAALSSARERAEAHEQARVAAEEEGRRLHEAGESLKRDAAERRRALTRESEVLLGRVRELWQTIQREARKEQKARGDVAALRSQIDQAESGLAGLIVQAGDDAAAGRALPSQDLTPGRMVRVSDLGVDAEIVEGPDPEGRVTLRRGNWTIHSRADRLVATEAHEAPRPLSGQWTMAEESPSLEVDVRGLDVDDALRVLDAGLDRAVVAGFQELRVIHGIGRGVLRQAVEKHLRGHAQVSGQRMAQQNEGGRGVTVATLR
jgi:DNA mismatch repair protein MutS2